MKIILFLSFIYFANCSQLVYNDCGPKDAVIKMNSLSLSPYPIKYPGLIDFKINMEVLHDISDENFAFDMTVYKMTPKKMKVPCLGDYGTCTFDYCSQMKKVRAKGDKDLFSAFADMECPVKAGKYNLDKKDRTMPQLGNIFDKIMEGSWYANVTYYNSKTRQTYGCLEATFDVEVKQLE